MKIEVICTEHSEYKSTITKTNWRAYAGGIYLHGILERYFGYDCVEFINPLFKTKILKLNDHTVKFSDIDDGIYECSVYGYDKPCTAFIWKCKIRNVYLGLIVDNTDIEAYNYAKSKYESKSQII